MKYSNEQKALLKKCNKDRFKTKHKWYNLEESKYEIIESKMNK